MSDVIRINPSAVSATVSNLKANGNRINVSSVSDLDICSNAQVLREYGQCLSEVKTLMKAYQSFLLSDANRIDSSVKEIIAAERNLLK